MRVRFLSIISPFSRNNVLHSFYLFIYKGKSFIIYFITFVINTFRNFYSIRRENPIKINSNQTITGVRIDKVGNTKPTYECGFETSQSFSNLIRFVP